jgi:hypothetical protein
LQCAKFKYKERTYDYNLSPNKNKCYFI